MLRTAREARGLSLRELAQDAGIYWVELMRYECAEQEPNIAHVYILANLLGTSLHHMLPSSPHLDLEVSVAKEGGAPAAKEGLSRSV